MTALITALASYIGVDFLIAILARFGIVGARAATAATVGKDVAPVLRRTLRRLHEERGKHQRGSKEEQEVEEELVAMKALMGGWFG